jgi:hypothetical protein
MFRYPVKVLSLIMPKEVPAIPEAKEFAKKKMTETGCPDGRPLCGQPNRITSYSVASQP